MAEHSSDISIFSDKIIHLIGLANTDPINAYNGFINIISPSLHSNIDKISNSPLASLAKDAIGSLDLAIFGDIIGKSIPIVNSSFKTEIDAIAHGGGRIGIFNSDAINSKLVIDMIMTSIKGEHSQNQTNVIDTLTKRYEYFNSRVKLQEIIDKGYGPEYSQAYKSSDDLYKIYMLSVVKLSDNKKNADDYYCPILGKKHYYVSSMEGCGPGASSCCWCCGYRYIY